MIERCPFAQYIPWQGTAYYANANKPVAVVQHTVEGWASVYRAWAENGHHRASVHYVIRRDGHIYQFLEHRHGGYHAGITAAQARTNPPSWTLWQGPQVNVNHYTIGVEHEGFSSAWPWPEAQIQASIQLNKWLAEVLDIPFDRDHFPAHADIDTVNRVNDFAKPADRDEYYRRLFAPVKGAETPLEEDTDMTPEQVREIVREMVAGEEIQDKRLREAMIKRFDAMRVALDPERVPGE